MPVTTTTTEETQDMKAFGAIVASLQRRGVAGTALGLTLLGIALGIAAVGAMSLWVRHVENSPGYRAEAISLERRQIEHERFLKTVTEPFIRLTGWSPGASLTDNNTIRLRFPALNPRNGSIRNVSVQVGKWDASAKAVLNRVWVAGSYSVDGEDGIVSLSIPAIGFFEPNRNYSFRLRVRMVGPAQDSEVFTYLSPTFSWWRSPK